MIGESELFIKDEMLSLLSCLFIAKRFEISIALIHLTSLALTSVETLCYESFAGTTVYKRYTKLMQTVVYINCRFIFRNIKCNVHVASDAR